MNFQNLAKESKVNINPTPSPPPPPGWCIWFTTCMSFSPVTCVPGSYTGSRSRWGTHKFQALSILFLRFSSSLFNTCCHTKSLLWNWSFTKFLQCIVYKLYSATANIIKTFYLILSIEWFSFKQNNRFLRLFCFVCYWIFFSFSL